MNPDQKNRLEIMQALEKDFSGRVLEDLIEVARYVEAGGIEQDSAGESAEEADDIPEWRTWAHLEHIPDGVGAVTDADGDVICRVALGDRLVWKFEDARYEVMTVTDDVGPFTEVLS